MAFEVNDINLEGTLSANTISATTIVFGGQPIQNVFVQNNDTGGFLPLSGGTVTGETIFNAGFSANTLSAATINSGATNLYSIFQGIGTGGGGSTTYVQPGVNITTGGTATAPIISVVDSPSFNNIIFSGTATGGNLSATTITATTVTNVDNIHFNTTYTDVFSTGNVYWENAGGTLVVDTDVTNASIRLGKEQVLFVRNSTGAIISKGKAVYISGVTSNLPNIQLADYNNPETAFGTVGLVKEDIGNNANGYVVLNGSLENINTNTLTNGAPIYLTTNGDYSSTLPGYDKNIFIIGYVTRSHPSLGSILVQGRRFFDGMLKVVSLSADTIYSGSTNLYDIFSTGGPGGASTYVQPGSNITTGGTETNPIISLVASPSVNNLTISGLTSSSDGATFVNLSGTNIFSGSTNLQSTFDAITARFSTKSNLSGDTFTGAVNVTTTLSAATLSAETSVFISSIKYPVSPVSGYILTSDASGNASWQANPVGTGATKLDMQSVSNQATTPTATGALVDVAGMSITAKNLGSSATTYYVHFDGDFSNNNNAGNSTFRIVKNGVAIPNAITNLTNAGAAMAGANRTVSVACMVTGVTNGDIIKVQMSAATGTLTARNKSLNIIGVLNINLV